jgi:hypothetical protein
MRPAGERLERGAGFLRVLRLAVDLAVQANNGVNPKYRAVRALTSSGGCRLVERILQRHLFGWAVFELLYVGNDGLELNAELPQDRVTLRRA